MSTQNGCSLATFLIEKESPNTCAISKQAMAVMANDGPSPHSNSLRLGLPAPQPSRRHHAQSLLGPSFHDPRTQHVLESHPEQAAPLSRRDDERRHAVSSHSALALRLYLAACNPSLSCCFWVLDHLCFQFVSIISLLLNHGNLIFEPVCVFLPFSLLPLLLWEMIFSFKSLFAIWSLSPLRFHNYFYHGIVSWQYQKCWTILILVLCLLCVTLLVCWSYSSFAPSSFFFSSWWQKESELCAHALVLQCSPSMSLHQPKMTHVFADSRIALLCHALRIWVAHAPSESWSFSLLVHWAFRACYRSHLPLLHHASMPKNQSVQMSIPGQPLWAPRWCFCVAR